MQSVIGTLGPVAQEPAAIFNEYAPDGLRVEDVLKIGLQAAADDERYSLRSSESGVSSDEDPL